MGWRCRRALDMGVATCGCDHSLEQLDTPAEIDLEV